MNMLKRTLAMMLVLCMLFTMAPITAFAEDTTDPAGTATPAADGDLGGNIPAANQTDANQPAANQPDADQPAADQPAADQPDADQPAADQPAANQPAANQPAADQPAANQPAADQPAANQPAANQPAADQPAADQPAADQPDADQPVVDQPAADQPATGETEEDPYGISLTAEIEDNVASSEGVYTGTVERPSEFMRVFHLDVGRKYFTVDEVKSVIDLLAANHYTHMELAIGNDGLRLLLDNMSITANGTTYSSADVAAGIKAGNVAYSHTGEWSQSEMDSILAYADTKGIEIIPLVNSPGHMDSILDAMEKCGIYGSYNGSARTVDITNADAVAFTQALVGKYMDYFAAKGCTYFNIGADEYANDIYKSGSMGWGHLISEELYDEFIEYVNELVAMAAARGLRPIAFNDGIYFQNETGFGTFDTRLIVAAWTAGWSGFTVAKTSSLAGKNHLILNTNDGWYYVLGRGSGTYGYDSALSNAENVSVTTVMDNNAVSPIGAMQCVWCDVPSVNYSSYTSNVVNIIETLAESNPDYFKAPEVVRNTVTDENTDVSVSASGLTDVTAAKQETSTPWTGYTISVTYDVRINGGDYTGEAEIKIPYDAAFDGCNAFIGNVGADTFEVTVKDGYFVGNVPHFSNVTISGQAREVIAGEDTVTSNGQSGTAYVLDTDGVIDPSTTYLIVNTGSDGTGYALTNNNGTVESTQVNISGGTISAENDSNIAWTFSNASTGNVSNGGKYIYPGSGRVYLMTSPYDLNIVSKDNSAYEINYYNYLYLVYYNGSWTGSYSSENVYLYAKTTAESWTIDAALQENRIASLTVTNDGYTNETWTAYEAALTAAQDKLSAVEAAVYNSESAANTARSELIAVVDALEAAKNALAKGVSITIKYQTANGTVIKTETVTVADNATTYNPANFTTENGKYYVVDDAYTTLTIDPKNDAEYEVIVTEAEENLDDVDPVQLEWWITNRPVESTDTSVPNGESYSTTNNRSVYYSEITARDAYGEEGMEITASVHVPATGKWDYSNQLSYWKSTRLTAENYQNDNDGSDKTAAGTDFRYIRYYSGEWAVSYDRTSWTELSSTDQLVAYYLQGQQITPEIDILFKDWGYTPGQGDNSQQGYVGLSVAVVYPDGTLSPAEDAIYPDTSVVFNYWENRDIGIVAPLNNTIYNISKITVTNGVHNGDNTTTNGWPSEDTITWEKKAIEYTDEEWFDEREVWTKADGGTPMVNGVSDNVVWPAANTAILVLIYLEPVQYDNNLIVQWVDDSSSTKIHEMQINVKSENETKSFYDVLVQDSKLPDEGTGGTFILDDNAYVTNSSNVEQTISKVITTIPNVAAQYKSGLYKYVGADLSADGMTLTLHYNVDPTKLAPMYVIDFGLPMTFSINDLVKNSGDMNKVEILEQPKYGTAVLNTDSITYTPTSILKTIDALPIKVTFNNGSTATVRVGIAPATSVYYEESFLLSDNPTNWTHVAPFSGTQTTAVLGEDEYNYGYDGNENAYAGKGTATGYVKGTTGASTSFTFTGTGFQFYANSWGGENASGFVTVYSNGGLSKMYMIDTQLSAGDTSATDQQTGGTYYGLPIISETSLPHGEYTVQLKQTNGNKPIYLDGVRILNTVKDQAAGEENIYYADQEDNPNFYEVRDMVLKAIGVEDLADSDYIRDPSNDRDRRVEAVKDMAGQVYNAVSAVEGSTISTIIIDENNAYDTDIAQDLLDNGPKNELYLYPGQTLTFNVNTTRAVQLGLKSPVGHANYTLNGSDKSISTTVDMFYMISEKAASDGTVNVTISVPQNEGTEDNGVLSVTLLKICDDPGVSFPALTQEDIENTLLSVYGLDQEEAPVEPSKPEVPEETTKPTKPGKPEKPDNGNKPGENRPGNGNNKPGKPSASKNEKQKDAKLKITFVNLMGKKVASATLTKTGTENQRCVFSAEEITANAPARRIAVWLLPVIIPYGSTSSIVVPVL